MPRTWSLALVCLLLLPAATIAEAPSRPSKIVPYGRATLVVPHGRHPSRALGLARRGWPGRVYSLQLSREIGMNGYSVFGYEGSLAIPTGPMPKVAPEALAAEQRLSMWAATTTRQPCRLDPLVTDWMALQYFVTERDHGTLWAS